MSSIYSKLRANLDIIAITGISGFIFWFIIRYVLNSDIQWHAELLHLYHHGDKSFPPNFLYYILLEIFSFFSGDLNLILVASGVVLTLALTAKYIITKKIVQEYLVLKGIDIDNATQKTIICIAAITLLFLFAIPDYYNVFVLKRYYLGRIVPNIWHNSTTIALFPFALLLFWEQHKTLISKEKTSMRRIGYLSFLVMVNCLIKPSFIFVYIPITGLFLLSKYDIRQFGQLLKNSIPPLVGLGMVILLQILIFQLALGAIQENPSKIVWVKAFKIWEYAIPLWYIPYSMLLSYTFPLVFLLLCPTAFFKNRLLGYTLLLTLLGLFISIFIGEDGNRAHHGNFFWQNFICCYFLMLVVTLNCLEKYWKGDLPLWKVILLGTVYLIHLLAGIGYFIHIGWFGSYY